MKSFIFPNSRTIAYHDYYNVFQKELELIKEFSTREINDLSKVLIFGCGYNFPDVLLFSSRCKNTIGIDIREVFYRDGLLKLIRSNHKEFSLFSSFFRACYKKRKYKNYHKYLMDYLSKKIDISTLNIHTVSSGKIPYPNDYFDFILSTAVLEHIENIPKSVKELYRVTKPSGFSIHLLHNYYSLTGSHAPKSIYEKFPWGHLLGLEIYDEFLTKNHLYLNKTHPDEFKKEFEAAGFNILAYKPADKHHNILGRDKEFQFEGEHLLKSRKSHLELEGMLNDELTNYPRELLLSRAYMYICRK